MKRLTRATSEVVNAIMGDLEGDRMGTGVAVGQLTEADRDGEAAITLIRDCRRSLGDESFKDEDVGDRDDLIRYIARMETAIDRLLNAQITGKPIPDNLFLALDDSRVLPQNVLAEVRQRQEGE